MTSEEEIMTGLVIVSLLDSTDMTEFQTNKTMKIFVFIYIFSTLVSDVTI